jgi:hypothetical protein
MVTIEKADYAQPFLLAPGLYLWLLEHLTTRAAIPP